MLVMFCFLICVLVIQLDLVCENSSSYVIVCGFFCRNILLQQEVKFKNKQTKNPVPCKQSRYLPISIMISQPRGMFITEGGSSYNWVTDSILVLNSIGNYMQKCKTYEKCFSLISSQRIN